MGWSWSWISPWAQALVHVESLINQLEDNNYKLPERAKYYAHNLDQYRNRYDTGERSLQLYSDMYSIKKKHIREVIK